MVSAFVFTYYTIWAFFTVSPSVRSLITAHSIPCLTLSHRFRLTQPFLASDSSVHSFFPPRVWAVRGPALILVGGLGVIGAFVGKVMMDEEKKKREKAQRVKQG